jgi:hypothetical protein
VGIFGAARQEIPRRPPDLLSSLMALANLMRLSREKAAHVDVGWGRAVGDPGFAPTASRGRRDDKSEGRASIDSRYLGWTERLMTTPIYADLRNCLNCRD